MMMGAMAVIWLIILIVVAARIVGPLLATRNWPGVLLPGRERKPEELARERYARGEIGWPEYQEMLLNLLKESYVRGELELAEYEERTSRVLDESVRTQDRLSPPHPPSLDASERFDLSQQGGREYEAAAERVPPRAKAGVR